jgi:hypothetical protein
MVSIEILYPQPTTTIYGKELVFRYKLLNNLEKYKTNKIVIFFDETKVESTLAGTYIFPNLKNGNHTISGYLLNKNNIKIQDTDFSVAFNVITQEYKSPNSTWTKVKTKLPQFIQDDYKTFCRFIEAYYEWQDKSNNPIFMPFTSEYFSDVDTTPEIFLSNFRIQYLNDFPDSIFNLGDTKNFRTIVKNIKQFYRSKGSEKSFRFLFRLLYNTYVDFYYPRTDLIKASGNLWVENVSVKVKNVDLSVVFNLKNSVIYQSNGASARVINLNAEKPENQNIIELFLGNIVGQFNSDLPVYSDINFEGQRKKITMDLLPVVTKLTITSKALIPGDKIYILPVEGTEATTGSGFFAVIEEVGSDRKVKKINIVNSGYDYTGNHKIYKKNKDGTYLEISGEYEFGSLTRYPGYYKTVSSSPSSRGKLQDNRKYQELSYVLKTEANVFQYADIVKRLVHPAGTGLFGTYLVKRNETLDSSHENTLNKYYSPFIGNYLPYTLNTVKNLRNDTYPNGDPVLYPTGLTDLYPSGFDSTFEKPDENTATQEHFVNLATRSSLNVNSLRFNHIPNVSDNSNINNYWVVFPHPNTLLNNNASIKNIKIRDFLRISIEDITTN